MTARLCTLCDSPEHNARTCPERGKGPAPQVIVHVLARPTSTSRIAELRYATVGDAKYALATDDPDIVWSREAYYPGEIGASPRALYLLEEGVAKTFPGMYARNYGTRYEPPPTRVPDMEPLEELGATDAPEIAVAEDAALEEADV